MDTNTEGFTIHTMKRPAKRPRLSIDSDSVEDIPEEWDLQTARAQNDNKLKAIFEGIFSKYGKDFTEVGDEIDLQTGKIVVDNGHLLGLQETEPRNEGQPWLDENEDGDSDNGEDPEEETVESHEPPLPSHEDDNIEGEVDPDSNDSLLGAALAFNNDRRSEGSKRATGKQVEDPGPEDPLWQTPDLPRSVATPTAEGRAKVVTPKHPTFIREPSPPGSGSLWTVPRRGRPPGRPRTEGKPKASPSKVRARAKPTYHSSPVAQAHDWSFSQIPDGDESDDPLQEYQPSPTPSRMTSVRGKRIQGPAFTLNRYLESNPNPKQGAVPRAQSATPTSSDDDADNDTSERDPHGNGHVAFGTSLQGHSSSRPMSDSKPPSFLVPRYKVPRSSHRIITPDEARMIIRLRHVEKMDMREIHSLLPNYKITQAYAWDYNHWTEARLDPPQLSAPWTNEEMVILEKLKDTDGLSWAGMKAELPGRSRKEIEYELIRLWVGEEVWNEKEWDRDAKGEDVPEQPSNPNKRKRPLDIGTSEVDPEHDGDTASCGFKMLSEDDSDSDFDENSDSDSVKSEAFSFSKLSKIDLEPAHSPKLQDVGQRQSLAA
ncbi:hypothetical protein N7448_004214 [Penicillium atrosanguineum]|uniref:uncharacterized protein n=1 Tax=Penicillium atrosanguineum TaxID=1132637 RepID=UPI0023917EFD|nr:uncharacterized protein N7443_003179 [Penicillium atrosanguineum]KAJ5140806.1 hypothetical protein N7448_004214 [Penicillium atrosanguineum]KAJ5310718.1 hypothetical protein N7443_003179 [Penicillium atrosanguineum]